MERLNDPAADHQDPAFRHSLAVLQQALQDAVATSHSNPGGPLTVIGLAIVLLTIASKLLRFAGIGVGEFDSIEFVAVLVTGLVLILAGSGLQASATRTGAEVTKGVAESISGMWVGSEYRPIASGTGPSR